MDALPVGLEIATLKAKVQEREAKVQERDAQIKQLKIKIRALERRLADAGLSMSNHETKRHH